MELLQKCLFGVLVYGVLACSIISAEEDGKIIGGEPVSISQFPYQISFQFNNQHFCGGSILNANYIVTAAHCVAEFKELNTNGLTIVAGQTKLSDSNGQRIAVAKMIPHPQYNSKTIDYDVAVLKLASPLSLNDNVTALPLTESSVKRGNIVTVSGWGTTARGGGGEVSDQLLSVPVRVQWKFICQAEYFFQLTNRMFCAGKPFGGSDSCQGDSGGPVKSKNTLAGIVSFGRGCGNILSPGIYTDVATVRDFILKNTQA